MWMDDQSSCVRSSVDQRLTFRAPEPASSAIVRLHRHVGECGGCRRFVSLLGVSIERHCVCGMRPAQPPQAEEIEQILNEAVRLADEAGKLSPWADSPLVRDGKCPYCSGPCAYTPEYTGIWDDEEREVVLKAQVERLLSVAPDIGPARRHWCLRKP
jgi:hypothetical protein